MVSFFVIILIVIGSIAGAFGNVLIKKGANNYSFFQLWKSSFLWGGLAFFVISTVLYLVVLRLEELSVVYPLGSLTYLWNTLFSIKYLGERMNRWKWLGLIGIIVGIVLIGVGS